MRWALTQRKYKRMIIIALMCTGGILFWFSVSFPLFKVGYSTVIYANNQALLGAHIAQDGQWRFPQGDSLPNKFTTSLLTFEDEYFYSHPGVNPLSMLRALQQNISQGKIVSGGSTLTMQVIRMATQRRRTVYNKGIELIQALRLELSYSKKEILEMYNAWGLKKMYGKEYMGVLRSTFIINEEGVIEKIIKKVNTKDHTKQIYTELEIN